MRTYSLEEVQRIYGTVSQHAYCFLVEHNGAPVGDAWLQEMNLERIRARHPGQDCRRIDLVIDKAYWGRGIGTEVVRLLTDLGFAHEGVDLIYEPGIADFNSRSRRAFEKNGYQVVQTIPQPPEAKAHCLYDLALTRDNWQRAARRG